MQRSVMRVSEQDGRKWISFARIAQATVRLMCGHVAREIEDAGWIIRLPKIVEEGALFAPELNGVRSFYPLQSR